MNIERNLTLAKGIDVEAGTNQQLLAPTGT
jgi:hypothetical protein